MPPVLSELRDSVKTFMSISSRTPEGFPTHCPVCGAATNLDFSDGGDAPCPACGCLLLQSVEQFDAVLAIIADQLGVEREKINPATSFIDDLVADSLDTVELVMELEEEFDVSIPDNAAEKIQTIGDFLRYLQRHRRRL